MGIRAKNLMANPRLSGSLKAATITIIAVINQIVSNIASAAPITFNTALPVAKGEFVWREQLVLGRSGKDPSGQNRSLKADRLISVVGYGASAKLAFFGVLPYSKRKLTLNPAGMNTQRNNAGIDDPTVFARYQFYKKDGTGQTLRLAGIAGVKLPIMRDTRRDTLGTLPTAIQQSNGAFDSFFGAVLTYQTFDFQLDSQISYRLNGTENGLNYGNETKIDTSLQYRMWPRDLSSGVPGFLYGVLEVTWAQKTRDLSQNGVTSDTSGGTTVFLSPGLQYVSKRYIIEAAFQVPLVQNLNGPALENKSRLRTGFRINF